MTHDMFANGFSETQRAVLSVFRLAVSRLPRISCSAHKQGWISLSMIDCPSCWAVPSRYEATAGSRAINAAGDGKTSVTLLTQIGISWYIVYAVALSEDWSSFATNFEVESLPTEVPQILSASHLHFPILSPRSNPWPQHHRQWKPTARQLPQPPVCLSSKSGHFLSANNILYWQ